MRIETFLFTDPQGTDIFVYRWLPDNENASTYRGIVQLAHGMAEYAGRYARMAEALTAEGFVVYANDHRGHGNTAATADNIGYIGKDGFNWMIKNLAQLTDRIREEMPDLPLILMGHSMGSFMVQKYMYLYPGKVHGIVLSGTNGKKGPDLAVGHLLAKCQAMLQGDRHRSKLLDYLSFGDFNRRFKPNRTRADWISRDEAEVDSYIKDPQVGGIFTAGFFRDFLQTLKEIHLPENMKHIPSHLPIYLFAGDKDPVGNMGKGILSLVELYRQLGMRNIQYKLYSGGRHEMLNEINREEVTQDLIAWLNYIISNE